MERNRVSAGVGRSRAGGDFSGSKKVLEKNFKIWHHKAAKVRLGRKNCPFHLGYRELWSVAMCHS